MESTTGRTPAENLFLPNSKVVGLTTKQRVKGPPSRIIFDADLDSTYNLDKSLQTNLSWIST